MYLSRLASLLRKNNAVNCLYNNIKGTSTTSRVSPNQASQLFSSTVRSAASVCAYRNAAGHGFRTLPEGFCMRCVRNMCTGASIAGQPKGGVEAISKCGATRSENGRGSLPPFSDEDWLHEFEKYKQSPEYKRINKGMTLEDFKFIYWMEYAHRMWGRALGIMFALPFSYFLRRGFITLQLGLRLSALFALGAGQGLIGWWMVKSGLEEPASEYAEPRVSPYRLAAHLTSAFVIYCGLLWTALSVVMPEPPAESVVWVNGATKVKRLALPVSLLVGITAVSGAFVAGNDAGRAYNTFPKMGDSWIPDDIFSMRPLMRNFFENTATVQLDHRILATATLASVGSLWWATRKLEIHPAVRSLIGSVAGMTVLQVTLGISTLLSYVPVSLGTAHQAGALTLLTLMILLNHTVRKPSLSYLKSLPSVARTT
ncbi:hypothetical protein Nepgr_007715 [Nepenthes gracilis]|uniref:Cytochrome c oxidase assembly protein COX15 n=1 Tax=Nepenthes gracilis TaxID=150966 RepID=A0AAD3S7D6_NEPGR|nr:hypothetical protein Nepgr_007715 [Nepenthes gracilis]